jgi:hypothetical protein
VIFVGDYIDRGPAIRETLSIVKKMSDAGKAIALMGNHEYNALAFHYKNKEGNYLREHKPKNVTQHAQTLSQFYFHRDEWDQYLEWFYTLPLYLDLPELRAVHACWDNKYIEWLKQSGYTTMTEELLIESHNKHSEAFKVIDATLKGKEINIPPEHAWEDKDGHLRTKNRIKWWKDPAVVPQGEFLFNCPDELKDKMKKEDLNFVVYPKAAPPVFFGHYWLDEAYPIIQESNVVCLDYSVAKDGFLVAYRFNGEQVINFNNFVVAPS